MRNYVLTQNEETVKGMTYDNITAMLYLSKVVDDYDFSVHNGLSVSYDVEGRSVKFAHFDEHGLLLKEIVLHFVGDDKVVFVNKKQLLLHADMVGENKFILKEFKSIYEDLEKSGYFSKVDNLRANFMSDWFEKAKQNGMGDEKLSGMTDNINKQFSIVLPILLNSRFDMNGEGEISFCQKS